MLTQDFTDEDDPFLEESIIQKIHASHLCPTCSKPFQRFRDVEFPCANCHQFNSVKVSYIENPLEMWKMHTFSDHDEWVTPIIKEVVFARQYLEAPLSGYWMIT